MATGKVLGPLRRRCVALGFATAIVLCFCPDLAAAGGPSPASVILISVDTLRADRLGCYGYRALPTPHIDAITLGATQFLNIDSQVPMTLPSHVSLLTSTYPFSNGVEDNGEVLAPGAVTLAGLLRFHGYRTAAFIGGVTLDHRFGLDQGFDFYDSPFDLSGQEDIDQPGLKRSAGEVTGAASGWLQNNSDRPFFLFLHLYDLHKPYSLPPHLRAQFRGREYDGEISYVDSTLGYFWARLAAKGLLDKCLVLFLSDHGESLGDHGERTHGYFIYESTIRVPLIIHWPRGSAPFPSRVDDSAGLIDVAPTILQFLRIAPPPQFQGQSLLGLLNPRMRPAAREIYGESLYASQHWGCSPLRSLRVGDYKYIDAERPELYNLRADPSERSNLSASSNSVAVAYRDRLQQLRTRFSSGNRPPPATISPEVARALSSLGYVASAGSRVSSDPSASDPKDKLGEYLKTQDATSLAFAGQTAQSVELLKSVLARDPDLIDPRNLLGQLQQKLGRPEDAAGSFRKVLERDPLNLTAHYNVGVGDFQLHRFGGAARELQVTLAIESGRGTGPKQFTQPAEEMLGKIWMDKGDRGRAREEFYHLLGEFPQDFAAHYNLGSLAYEDKKWGEATRHLRAAVEIEPNNALAHFALGTVDFQTGELADARAQLTITTKLDPKFAQAHYYLGLALSQGGMRDDAAREFRKAQEADPKYLPAQQALQELEHGE